MKFQRIIILISLFLILNLSSSFAQDNDEDDDEQRFLTIHLQPLYGQSTPELNTLISLVRDELPALFDGSNLSPIIESDPEFSAVTILFDVVGDTVFINFNSIPPLPQLLPSPTLIPHPASTFPLEANINNPLWRRITTQFTLALGNYIYGNCEGMLPYLDDIENDALNIEELSYAQETVAYLNFYRANCAIASEDYETAQTLYETILAYYSDNNYDFRYGLETRINLAWIHYQQGETTTAYQLLNRVIGLAGSNWASIAALEMRASFYVEEEEFELAIEDLDSALEIVVDDPYLIGKIIHILIEIDDLRGASKELNRLTKIEDGYPVILFYQGLLAYAEGDISSAESFLSEFLSLGLNDYLTLEAELILSEIYADG